MRTRRLTQLVLAGLTAMLVLGGVSAASAVPQTYNGDVVRMTISDTAGPNIGVKPSTNPGGAYVNQYFGGTSWGSVCWLDNAGTWSSYGSGYPSAGLTAVSNVTNVIPGGAEIVTVVDLGTSGVQMTQKFTHMTGDRFITKEWSIHNGGSTTFSGARFYHGGDTLFGGEDSARGFYDASKSMVYVRNSDYTNWGIMGFYANPGTPADRYFEGQYNTGTGYAFSRTDLPNTADSTFLDAGYYLEWDRSGLAPGETWGISSYEIWTPAGALQIVAPGTQNAAPDSTVTLPFTVQNLGNTPLNLTLSAASNSGWTTTVVGGTSVTIAPNSSITQNVQVDVPVGATGADTVTLTSSGDAVGSASTTLNIANISLGISPASIDFGSLAPGATGQQLVTITNNSGAPITFGTVSAIAPFGRVSDNVSGQTLADGASLTVMATFSSNTAGAHSGSLNIPVVSPLLITRTIALSGTVASNQPPVAVADSIVTDEDTGVSANAAGGVLGNDSDPDGDPLTANLVTDVSHGTLALGADGSYLYTPHTDFFGTDSFSYRAYDGSVYSNTVTVSITVVGTPDAPVSAADSYTGTEDSTLDVAPPGVLGNDVDVDFDELTALLVTDVEHGTLTLRADGSFTYVPHANWYGTDSFEYNPYDGALHGITATVTLTITPVNDPPVAVGDSASVNEDSVLTVDAPGVLGNDSDPVECSALTADLVTDVDHGTLAFSVDGSYTYTPAANYNGADSFTYRAFDGDDYSSPVTVELTVNSVNDAPVATDDSATTAEDTALSVAAPGVLANDSDTDGDPLTADLVTDVSHGTLALSADGAYTYTPAANHNGTDSFTYRAFDGTDYSDAVTVSLTITPVYDAPVAVADVFTAYEDTTLNVAAPGLLANDLGDGPLKVTAWRDSAHGTRGTVTAWASGRLRYVPEPNFHGADYFVYRISDASNRSLYVTVTVNVMPVNDAPVATGDSAATNEDTAVSIDVLANDSDIDGDPLTADVVGQPEHGAVTQGEGGVLVYTPAANYNGTDSFTYRAFDGTDYSNVVIVDLTIAPVADAPIAAADSATTAEDTVLSVDAPGVLGNDVDGDGDALTAALVTDVAHGTLALAADGSYTYTPDENFNGTDSFTYHACDSDLNSEPATVTITVTPVNDAPVAAAWAGSTDEGGAMSVAAPGLLTGASDVDGDSLTATITVQPNHGALVLSADGSFVYTPHAGFTGTDTFAFKVSDGITLSAEQVASITINAVNHAPVATADGYSIGHGLTLTVAAPGVLSNDTDADADALTATSATSAAHGTLALSANGGFVYTPASGFSGTDTFTYRASDGALTSAPAIVTITVGRAPAEKTRFGGVNRYEVARRVAESAFPSFKDVRNVVVVSGSDRAAADPITAGAIAGLYDGPILLVNENLPTLPADTIRVLKAIDSATTARINVRIVGGTASVPEALKAEIKKSLPSVTFERIGGADRYEVAANVAGRIKKVRTGRGKTVDAVFIANGQTQEGMFSALALSPIAAHDGMPVLLVRSESVPAATLAALSSLGVPTAKRYAAGGSALVSAKSMQVSGVPSGNRIQGADATRASTAAAIAQLAITKGWLSDETVGVANSLSDALTGGMLMGKAGGPLLYTSAGSMPVSTTAFLREHRTGIVNVSVFGGTASINDSVITAIGDALK